MSQWDSFVARHPWGTIYHTYSWKSALESSFSHIQGFFLGLVEHDSGALQAGWPVYTVKSWILGNRLVSVPLASTADPLISSVEHAEPLLAEILKLHHQNGARTLELKTLHGSHLITTPQLAASRFFKHHALLLHDDPENLKSSFSKTAVQQMIAKAIKAGMEVEFTADEEALKQFYDLLMQTRQRLSLPPIPFRFFYHLWQNFAGAHLTILLARLEKKPIAGLLLLKYNRTFAVEYAADQPQYRRLGVNQLLYWEAIKRAYHDGFPVFSFGRTSPENKGLMTFKRRWGTTEADIPVFVHPISACVPVPASEQGLPFRLVRWASRHAPPPFYNWLGRICYRHWA